MYLDSALGLSTSSLMGIYSIDVAEDSLYLAYNTMTPSHTFVIGRAELGTTTGATTANPHTPAASLPESVATLDDGSLVAMMADGSTRVYAAGSGLTNPATVPALDLSAQAGAVPGGSGAMKVLSTGTTWIRAAVVGSEDTTRSFTGWVHLLNDQPMTVRLEVFDASGSLVVIDENALSIDAALDPESAAGCDTAGIESPVISQVSQEGAVVSVTLTRCDGYYLVTHDFASSTTTVETLATPVGSTTLKPGLVVETTAGRRWLYTQNQLPGSSETPVTFMRAFWTHLSVEPPSMTCISTSSASGTSRGIVARAAGRVASSLRHGIWMRLSTTRHAIRPRGEFPPSRATVRSPRILPPALLHPRSALRT